MQSGIQIKSYIVLHTEQGGALNCKQKKNPKLFQVLDGLRDFCAFIQNQESRKFIISVKETECFRNV